LDTKAELKRRKRFIKHTAPVPTVTNCILWTGYVDPNGYGKLNGGGLAHREAYELYVGPVPPGAEVTHRCAARACVNPDHLMLSTRLS
jgi:hypothetical protein